MRTTRFTELVGCRVPIQQAGMGHIATAPLVRAVSEAGGVGTLGAAGVSASALAAMMDELPDRAAQPFGVNFLIPFVDPECARIAANRARIVEFFYGDPDARLVEIAHQGGALACWQVGSRAEAIAAADAGCDLIVAQGVEAGGHVRGHLSLLPLLDQVLDAVEVPVVAAGGIGTGRAMAAALAAGADAVRVGTRFVVAEESAAHPAYIAALIAAQPEDAILTEAFSQEWPNAPHRVLRSSIEAANAFPGESVGTIGSGVIARYSSMPPTRGVTGIVAAMALYAGQSVGSVTRRQSAGEIVREMAEHAEAMLRLWR